jgi:signal transduction histidine kinase/HPt (histidine-containing phosphotransfer) domain-containing protein/AmiR/NasT family two-component response regulator
LSAVIFAVYQENIPAWTWQPGLVLYYLATLLRAMVIRQYRHAPNSRSSAEWGYVHTALAGLTGSSWGLAATSMLAHISVEYQLFVIAAATVTAATSASGGFTFVAPSRIFMVMSLTPQIVWLLSYGDRLHAMLALLLMIFLPVTFSQTRKRNRVFLEAQRLRFRNEAMARDLAIQRDAAETATRTKGEFLANMSHEIRTPLNAILGFARIGVRDNPGRKTGESYRHILNAGQHLMGVLNDVLDFSKIEAGKFIIEQRQFKLAELATEASNLIIEPIRQKGLAFELEIPPDISRWVEGDDLRTRQILVNLLSNAVKFTERGTIHLRLTQNTSEIIFDVIDTGIGMSDQHLARLFTAFEQADASTTRKFGGTGLGLAISQRLAHLMGGEITVTSEVGQGSTFSLRLPLSAVPAPEETFALTCHASQVPLDGIHVLAAEDVYVNRLILADALQEAGATAEFVENGRLAVERVELSPQDFSVVLMDVQMPEMDGYEATCHIKRIAPDLPVIGLTAHALAEERHKCLQSGMADHLGKPIESDVLVAAILRHARPLTAATSAIAPLRQAGTSSGNIATDEIIDWSVLNLRFRGKHDFVKKLFRTVLSDHTGAPARFRALGSSGDFSGLALLAHSFKGMAGNIAARPVTELAAKVEAMARQEDSAVVTFAQQLAEKIEELLAVLKQHIDASQEDALSSQQ